MAKARVVTDGAPISIDIAKRHVDGYLDALFAQRIAQAQAISVDYAALWESIARLSSAGGKRLRPYIMLLAYGIYKPNYTVATILPAAAAQELLHLAMLTHDDIIDRDQVRYGVKNVIGQYNDAYAPYITDGSDRLHFSNSAAIMAGDLLIAEAYQSMQQCDVGHDRSIAAQQVLSDSLFRIVGGELLDVEATFRASNKVDALAIAREKTASYSFVGPLVTGALLAGAPDEDIENLREFGMALGVVFQLQDDLLGVFGNAQTTGKSTSGDITEGKRTYLVEQFYSLANEAQKVEFTAIFKNHHASTAGLQHVQKLLVESGAKTVVHNEIDELARTANAALSKIVMSAESREAFTLLVKRCTTRSK